jgi:tRNA-dihydrouridine synthase B
MKCTGSVLDAVKIPVGVKLRGGWSEKRKSDILRIAKDLEGIGISHVSVHPRTVRQGYSGNADHGLTESVSRRVEIPVIASGDIQNGSDAVSLISKGLDGVMIGRALLGNPLWFELFGGEGTRIDDPGRVKKMILDVALDHLDLHMRFHSGGSPIAKFRKHISWYLRGVPGKRRYLERIYRTEDEEEVRDILTRIGGDLGSATSEHRVNLPNF